METEETPGPGNYNDSEVFSPNNSYTLSTHKKSVGALISPRGTPKYVEFSIFLLIKKTKTQDQENTESKKRKSQA